jgi:hypothetical protein
LGDPGCGVVYRGFRSDDRDARFSVPFPVMPLVFVPPFVTLS